MTADFRCSQCGHPMSLHVALSVGKLPDEAGCSFCDCQASRISEDAPATEPTEPTDPMTQTQEGAAMMHELFQAYVEAGFERSEAMELVKAALVEGMRSA